MGDSEGRQPGDGSPQHWRRNEEGPPEPQPRFLDMVPWYTGTSADLLKTAWDLIVAAKLFLGRFDLRVLQALEGGQRVTAAARAGGPAGLPFQPDLSSSAPRHGDGFTFEHLAEGRQELWMDFMADTGDGGNSTYSVARCLAAPELQVSDPRGLIVHPANETGLPAPKQLPRANTDSLASKLLPLPLGGRWAPGGEAAGPAPRHVLPRADVLVIGGDLSYPNPSEANYQDRLWRPFEDALPPPQHYHPNSLAVNKPDLGPKAATSGEDPERLLQSHTGPQVGVRRPRSCPLPAANGRNPLFRPSALPSPGTTTGWTDSRRSPGTSLFGGGWAAGCSRSSTATSPCGCRMAGGSLASICPCPVMSTSTSTPISTGWPPSGCNPGTG